MKKVLALFLVISMSISMGMQNVVPVRAVETTGDGLQYSIEDSELIRYDDIFQYHYAGGTDNYNAGISDKGKMYDAYLWVPNTVAPGNLKGLVAVKMNLIEVPFVNSSKLRTALAEKDFGILFLVFQKDDKRYNTTFSNFNTRLDYKGDILYQETDIVDNNLVFTADGKDAADIMNEILSGVAETSGYTEIAEKTPLITVGHSAASPFGYRSGNWNPDRIIAQVHMKNGMGGPLYNSTKGVVPGIPSLQYAAQYTEHSMGVARDRSVQDARWHISNQRKNTNMLVSHIIEWGSGHYDWSDNATDMMIRYIQKAIAYRLPDNYSETGKLNDLTNSGYLMKPFEKDEDNQERAAGYYQQKGGWLSGGQNNAGATEADKKASFWFFDQEFADEINAFTNYAIPESPDSNETKVEGKTYSDIEPFMLMKNPSQATWSNTTTEANTVISPYTTFAGNPFSRYGSNRFVNYQRMAKPDANANNAANLGGYDTLTVDTYYMNKVPSITGNDQNAYDGAGNDISAPEGVKAPYVPLIAPYEYVSSELISMEGMTQEENNTEAANVASVTRTTLRFHNNRVYYRSGCAKTNEYNSAQDSYGFIYSPEVKDADGTVTSCFKATGVQMNVPYTGKGSQTLELHSLENVCIADKTENPAIDVTYTSSDADLQKYTDVFVEYGPAKAIRTVNDEDGSYSWKVEVLLDQIPANAEYPIEVNVVASNLGKWETVAGATDAKTFYITQEETKSGVYLDDELKADYDSAVNAAINDTTKTHTLIVHSDQSTNMRSNLNSSADQDLTVINGDFKATVTQNSSNMMFLINKGAKLILGKETLSKTNTKNAFVFDANNKARVMEVNTGTVTVNHGVVIKNGTSDRGSGVDGKNGSTVYIKGGIITGNTATGSGTAGGGGGIDAVGTGKIYMSDGLITGNASTTNQGGGAAVLENGQFHMSGGTIKDNTGYDVYVNNNNFSMSGSAYAGNVYLAEGKAIQVEGEFTTKGAHAVITPASYEEGKTVVTYASGLTPKTSDFTVEADGDIPYYLYSEGQELKLTTTAPVTYSITTQKVTVSSERAEKGEIVTVTVPDTMVAGSLIARYKNSENKTEDIPLTEEEDGTYSFVVPGADVTVSCLTNSDSRKIVIVGTTSSYYVKNDHQLTVSFDVPALEAGYHYTSAEVYVPVRTNGWNASNMTATMGGASYTVVSGEVTGSADGSTIQPGAENKLVITNEKEYGVDYYYNQTNFYAVTASNLATLTLTIEEYPDYIKNALLNGISFQGAQIRTTSGSEGFRFISVIKRTIKEGAELPEGAAKAEYGTLLIPEIAFGETENPVLDLDKAENGVVYEKPDGTNVRVMAAKVPSTVDYENLTLNPYVKFAILMMGFDGDSVYKQKFIVRPYLIYKDAEGNQIGETVYGEQEVRSMQQVAKAVLNDSTVSYTSEERAYLAKVAAE